MTHISLKELKKDIQKQAKPERAKASLYFFKTGKGQYGEGDIFVGLSVPQSRVIAEKYKSLPFFDIKQLLKSKIHEQRLISLFILIYQFQKGTEEEKKNIYEFYLEHASYVNNWDLVDTSADKIVGGYLMNKDRSILKKLAKSQNLWERRIAMIATYWFIKQNKFDDVLTIAEILVNDKHDLIQKAVGWMLREIGKRDQQVEENFLKTYYKIMPRTMLRYAIEKFPQTLRKEYLEGRV